MSSLFQLRTTTQRQKKLISKILLMILAVFLPPLAVVLRKDDIETHFWISICLTILAWVPGVLHAWYVIFSEAQES